MDKRHGKYTTAQLREYIDTAQGSECAMPECHDPWQEMAHIEDSGMGGRDNRTPSNLLGLCRTDHQAYDQNKRRIPRELFRYLKLQLLRGQDDIHN